MLTIAEYKSEIEYNLKNSSHRNLKSLYYDITSRVEINSKDTQFFEALTQLMKENKIVISGYDFDNHKMSDNRHQTIMRNWLAFEWIKNEQTQILTMLNLMDTDLENGIDAKETIIKIFRIKFEQYLSHELDFYDTILSKVVSASIEDWIKIKENECSLYNTGTPDDDIQISYIYEEIEMYKKKLENNPKSQIWHLKSLNQDELDEINKFNTELPYYNLIGFGTDTYFPYYCLDDQYTEKQYLDKLNFFKPLKSDKEVRRIFNRIIFFVNTHENYKVMKQYFALALSDEQDSSEYFELFVNYDTPSIKKFKKELGY